MLLKDASETLIASVVSAVTTPLKAYVEYEDVIQEKVTHYSQLTSISAAGDFTICDAPAPSTARTILEILIFNDDGATHDTRVRIGANAVKQATALASKATLQYTRADGWSVRT